MLVHNYPQDAIGQAVPYDVYTLNTNQGYVCVGDCFSTPRFAVEAIDNWWYEQSRKSFPNARRLLILADVGGPDSCRSRVWKAQLQEQSCEIYRLDVTLCYYPNGCSKWNPIEHRIFSHISMKCAGKPLRMFELMCAYIEGTTTSTGLTVKANLVRGGNDQNRRK